MPCVLGLPRARKYCTTVTHGVNFYPSMLLHLYPPDVCGCRARFRTVAVLVRMCLIVTRCEQQQVNRVIRHRVIRRFVELLPQPGGKKG